jgi:hypothetical protein
MSIFSKDHGKYQRAKNNSCMKFQVFSHNICFGYSYLESGDPPMGVVFGKFYPTEEYNKIKSIFQKAVDIEELIEDEAVSIRKKIESIPLKVKAEDQCIFLEPNVGIIIEDFRHLIEDDIQITILGLDHDLYKTYFPELSQQYWKE